MASFSWTEAAFEGFRLTREHPAAVVAWSLAYFVFTLAIGLLAITWGVGQDLAALKTLSQGANPDPVEMLRVFDKLAPYVLVAAPLQVVFFAVLNCAIYRAVLRPYERGLGYFRLGSDEFRMIALVIILFLLWLVSIFVVTIVVGFAAGTLGVFGGGVGAFVGALIGASALGAAIWVLVRLSLAAPMTFAERRLVVFSSWSSTRGSFWPLAAAYVLAFLLGVVILVLLGVIFSALFGATVMATGGSLSALGRLEADADTFAGFLTVPSLLSQAFSAAMITIYYVIVLSPSVIAYQGLAHEPHQLEHAA